MKEVYIISQKRGQGETEILMISDSYPTIIKKYYDTFLDKDFLDERHIEWVLNRYFIFKIPINTDFVTKLQKTSQYRLKFTSQEFMSDYKSILRDEKIDNILK